MRGRNGIECLVPVSPIDGRHFVPEAMETETGKTFQHTMAFELAMVRDWSKSLDVSRARDVALWFSQGINGTI